MSQPVPDDEEEEEENLVERLEEGIEDAHEENFASKDEVEDAFLS